MAHQPAEPYIGSTNYEGLRAGDVIVPWEADRDPALLKICGTWTVTSVDFAPAGPCCLPRGHVTLTTDRDVRPHQRRDQPVKIIAPERFWRLANICRQYGWHLRRGSDGTWYACRIGSDNVYRRLWPTQQHSHFPGKEWVWEASYGGSLLGSGTGTLADCWSALHQVAPPSLPSTPPTTTPKKGTCWC